MMAEALCGTLEMSSCGLQTAASSSSGSSGSSSVALVKARGLQLDAKKASGLTRSPRRTALPRQEGWQLKSSQLASIYDICDVFQLVSTWFNQFGSISSTGLSKSVEFIDVPRRLGRSHGTPARWLLGAGAQKAHALWQIGAAGFVATSYLAKKEAREIILDCKSLRTMMLPPC